MKVKIIVKSKTTIKEVFDYLTPVDYKYINVKRVGDYAIEITGDIEVESTGLSLWFQKNADCIFFHIALYDIAEFLIQEGK